MPSQIVSPFSRRRFLALAAAATVYPIGAAETKTATPRIVGFSKPFQKLSPSETAAVVGEVGWQGIECPVRKGGQIEPEKVEAELPELQEALRKQNLEIEIITTDVEDAENPLTQRVLRTASKLGIGRYRMKHYYYDLAKPIAPQLESFKAKVRGLVALNKELNLQGSIQNHSGRNYVGAPVWDIIELIREFDPKQIGIFFDIGHATVEGGLSWPIEAKLAEPFFSVISVKDFLWTKPEKAGSGWNASWCPLGEGMIRPQFFTTLKRSGFAGPITQHIEYTKATGRDLVALMKKDAATLKRWLAEA